MTEGVGPWQMVVFSDDWGRHPSSCQHLVRHLSARHRVLWVNTIGTRRPGLSRGDLKKVIEKLAQWTGLLRRPLSAEAVLMPENLHLLAPVMWPGFRKNWQRRVNAALIAGQVNRVLDDLAKSPRGLECVRCAVLTTLPITADLVGRIRAERWVYYCVDDFSVWPGADGAVMEEMERELVGKVDAIVAASEALRQRIRSMGQDAALLTHGIDLKHWSARADGGQGLPEWWAELRRPILLFWGLIDRRLDVEWVEATVREIPGTLVLVGPQQDPPERLEQLAEEKGGLGHKGRLVMPGAVAYERLPALAEAADVLVMPYADLPVTRAMQPLKFKEYLAAGWPERFKAVVARALPAVTEWAEAADLVQNTEEFLEAVRRRWKEGPSREQCQARRRLEKESWAHKAGEMERILFC